MGVRNMNIYKETIYLLSQICFSILIIVFSYYLWSNFDQTSYNIAKYYDNTKEVQITFESNVDKGYQNNNSIVSVHNVSDKLNNKDIILKINKENNLNNIKLDINTINYNLNDLFITSDDIYNYYLIENIDLNGYETKTYFIDFILDNNIILNDYEFLTEL